MAWAALIKTELACIDTLELYLLKLLCRRATLAAAAIAAKSHISSPKNEPCSLLVAPLHPTWSSPDTACAAGPDAIDATCLGPS